MVLYIATHAESYVILLIGIGVEQAVYSHLLFATPILYDNILIYFIRCILQTIMRSFSILLFTALIFEEIDLPYYILTKNLIGSGGVYLHISSKPSVICGMTLSIKYCRIGLDF